MRCEDCPPRRDPALDLDHYNDNPPSPPSLQLCFSSLPLPTMTSAVDPRFVPVLLTLPSFTPSLALEVLPHGVTFHRLYVQADGKTHDIILGPESPETHARQKYNNSIVGRYSNRVPVSGATSFVNGDPSSAFQPISNESPTVSLHGGPGGFDNQVWEPILNVRETKLFSPEEVAYIESELPGQSAVVFSRVSPDGEEGYPGTLRVETLVALVPPKGKAVEESGAYCLGSVLIVYRARLEDTDKVSPVNLTQVRA